MNDVVKILASSFILLLACTVNGRASEPVRAEGGSQPELLQSVNQLGAQQNASSAATSPNEAMQVANQYQIISNNIKTQGIINSNSQSIFNMSVLPNVKNILSQIQLLSQDLMGIVMPGSIPTSPDPAKLDDIINKLGAQQQQLSNLIQSQSQNQTTPSIQSTSTMQPSSSSLQPNNFNPADYDRPKENGFQVYK